LDRSRSAVFHREKTKKKGGEKNAKEGVPEKRKKYEKVGTRRTLN